MADSPRPSPNRVLAHVVAWTAVANLVGAVLAFIFFVRILEEDTPASDGLDETGLSLALFVGYVAVLIPLAVWFARSVVARDYSWNYEGRPPTWREQEAVLREPRRLGVLSFGAWLGAAALFSGLDAAFGASGVHVARNVVGIVFGGFITSLLTFLLVERALRPVIAQALAGAPPLRRGHLGVRPRLMLSWALGSAVPLLGIVLAIEGPTHVEDPSGAVLFLAFVGVLAGSLSMYVAARSVSDPLEAVREAVGRVGQGDLDVEVTVDDGGEVGLLQAGVNQMVAGLRERQRLRDLFGRHVGDEVARQALARGAGLGGEQREASALFVDLIGSTHLAGTRPAAEVVALLNELFGAVVDAAAAEGGWVNKFEGDGALCVFGAPADQPDHAARALLAARRLRDEVARLRAADTGRGALDVGIGVSSGLVVAGNVGSEERYEYTVIGDPVNEAARLTDLAKDHPARLLASEHAVRRAGDEGGQWELVGEFELRGRGEPTCSFAPR